MNLTYDPYHEDEDDEEEEDVDKNWKDIWYNLGHLQLCLVSDPATKKIHIQV
jgi:hypothetical protein